MKAGEHFDPCPVATGTGPCLCDELRRYAQEAARELAASYRAFVANYAAGGNRFPGMVVIPGAPEAVVPWLIGLLAEVEVRLGALEARLAALKTDLDHRDSPG